MTVWRRISRLLICLTMFTMLISACGQRTNIKNSADGVLENTETGQAEVAVVLPKVRVTEVSEEEQKAAAGQPTKKNAYQDLCVPTYITRIDGLFFIVDCYHDQVIYNENLTDPLIEWSVLSDQFSKPHTIASDGRVYLIDDTESHCVQVYEKSENGFIHTETIENTGNRPHYIQYDADTETFFVWSSQSGEMFLIKREAESGHMYLSERLQISKLKDCYVRSFTLEDDVIWFVSGNSCIIKSRKEDLSIIKEYPVPNEMAGMIQLSMIDNVYYITISTDAEGNQDYATIIRTKDLDGLMTGVYEDIYDKFIGGGTPYYISEIDGVYYMTEHRLPGHSVWRFEVDGSEICNVQTVY